jgi:hypothetical protein
MTVTTEAAAAAPEPQSDLYEVAQLDTGWAGHCLHPLLCGTPGGDSFISSGWPTEASARKRMEEHIAEHEGGLDEDGNIVNPMTPLHEFRAQHAPELLSGS